LILCVAGNPSVDKLFEVEQLTVGGIHRPLRFVQTPGGKGIHIAQVASVLGADAMVLAVLGGHAGRWVAETLETEGIRGRFAWMEGETRSSLSVADRQTEELTEFYEAGTPMSSDDWSALEAIVVEQLPGASWLALAGSLPPGAPRDGYARLIAAAQRTNVATAVDTRGEPLARALDQQPDLVKINAFEAAELLGVPVNTLDQGREAVREVRHRAGGAGHAAVVTMGPSGAVLAFPDGSLHLGSPSTRGAYPVGSGDAFLAGMLVALARGDGWLDAAALGLGAAAANADTPGAARLDPTRAAALAADAQIERTE